MFELKKLITAMILPPFNILILWGLSLILAKFNFKKLSRISTALGFSLLYLLSIPYTAQVLKDSLITEDHLTLQDYQQAQAIVLLGGGLRDSKELYAPLASTGIQVQQALLRPKSPQKSSKTSLMCQLNGLNLKHLPPKKMPFSPNKYWKKKVFIKLF